jgi:hypothetical protein
MYTTTDIISHSKGTLYAPQGAEVTIIHVTGQVAICEYNGERFPCRYDLLSEVKPVVVTKTTPRKLSAKEAQLVELYERMK